MGWQQIGPRLQWVGETFLGEFGADAGLLGAAERDVRGHVEMLVDPDRAGLDLAGDGVGTLDVGRPDRRAEAVSRGVGAADHVILVGIFDHR